jgi:hypothetical protein
LKDVLDRIFERELNRLDEASKKQALDLEDLRRLDLLTRSVKSLQDTPVEEEDTFKDLSSEEIIKLLKAEEGPSGKAEPEPVRPPRPKAGSKKGVKK